MIRSTDLTDIKYVPHLLFWISVHPSDCIYVSAKGKGFDQTNGVALLQIIFLDQVFILDPCILGKQLFQVSAVDDPTYTLQHVLQDPQRLKIGFDLRSLSSYLYQHFDISLRGVLDLQVLDAQRNSTAESPYLSSLNKAIFNANSGHTPKWIKQTVSDRAKKSRTYVAQKGGDPAALYKRPLPRKVIFYCAIDAILLPYLMTDFFASTSLAQQNALLTSGLRLLDAMQSDFVFNAPERKLKAEAV